MKINFKISIFLALFTGVILFSCDDTLNMDLLDDPNNITVEKADLDRYMNTIQIDFSSFAESMGYKGSQLTRVETMRGRQYINNYDDTSSDAVWRKAYQELFSDMKDAERIANKDVENVKYKHIAVIKILRAYTLMTLVDFFGDIPYSEMTQPEEFPFPKADDDQQVYLAVVDMLDSAIADLAETAPGLANDFYYGNNFSKWEKLANTLKMKVYATTRLVDANAVAKFNDIVDSGNFIMNTNDDFQFQYGTSLSNPSTRHTAYKQDYTTTGAGRYRSNWLMNEMKDNNDPRIRYYFYRQVSATPGVDAPANGTTLPCSVQSPPPHYPVGMVFCGVAEGYWGADHGRSGGIPPDTFKRAVVGIYPAGGRFDDNDFSPVGQENGGQGAGITPIMLASWVDLMRAEMIMDSDPAGAASFLQDAMTKSINKVMSFGSLDATASSSYFPTSSEVSDYITGVISDFNTGDMEAKWDVFAKEFLISHYGNGIDSYNFYRRTGYPLLLQYSVEPIPGNFVRSFFYPANEANVNSNIEQKPNVDVQVFWDNNPASPVFPAAN